MKTCGPGNTCSEKHQAKNNTDFKKVEQMLQNKLVKNYMKTEVPKSRRYDMRTEAPKQKQKKKRYESICSGLEQKTTISEQ